MISTVGLGDGGAVLSTKTTEWRAVHSFFRKDKLELDNPNK